MKFKSTVVLAGVVAVLGGLLANFDKVSGPSDEELKSPKLASYDADQISQIDIISHGQTISLTRAESGKAGAGWEVTTPVHGRASNPEVDALGTALASLKASSVVAEHAPTPALAQYGLEKPAVRFVVHLKNSNETATLDLGDHSPNGAGFYVRQSKSDGVYLGGTSLTAYTLKPATEWRDKSPIAFEVEKVDHFSVEGPSLHLEASKEKDDVWTFTRPDKRKGDATQIKRYLEGLKGAPIQVFADNIKPKDPRTQARYTIKVWHNDSREAHELILGAEAPGKNGVYAVRGDELHEVFVYPNPALKALHKELAELADRSLFDLDPNQLGSAYLELKGQKPVRAVRDEKDSTWSFEQPVRRNDELGKLTSLAYTIKQLKYERLIKPGAETTRAHVTFKPPYARISFKESKGDKTHTLVIGGKASPGTGRYVQVDDNPEIYATSVPFVDEWKGVIASLKQPAPADKPASPEAKASPEASTDKKPKTADTPSKP